MKGIARAIAPSGFWTRGILKFGGVFALSPPSLFVDAAHGAQARP